MKNRLYRCNNLFEPVINFFGSMTCFNIFMNMFVEFEKCGTGYVGKIKDMPFEGFSQLSKQVHGERIIKKAIADAEEVFLRAVIQRDIDEKG